MNGRKWLRGALAVLGALLAMISISGAQIDTALPRATPEAKKDTIDFGPVVVGRSGTATYTFKVLETSQTSATVTITRPHAPFDLQEIPTGPFTLAPGQSITFTVIFLPAEQGSYADDFTITSEGGYPPQRTTTIVTLTGRGVMSGQTQSSEATSPSGPASPATEMTGPFGFPLSATETAGGAVPGTTDPSGAFSVTLSPITTVTGSLSVCEEGQPLANQPFDLDKTSDGYAVAAAGFAPVTVQEANALTIFGLTSVDLGDVCLTPVPPVVEVPVTEGTCEIKYEWLRKTPIQVIEPLDYFPKQCVMPLGGIIAFHIRATDQDVLKQTCYGCVEGESVKRIGPVADVVSNHWRLTTSTVNTTEPAGKLLGWSAGNYGDVLYQLPEKLPEGMSVMDHLDCRIDDLEGQLGKADDEPLNASVLISMTGEKGNTCRVMLLIFQPDVPDYDDDVTERSAEDCTPAREVWEEESKLRVSAYVSECMCAGQLYRLHVHPSNIDVDFLNLRCDAVACKGTETKLRVTDPTTPVWSDNGAGGTFPLGNKGFGVTYQAPATGKEVRITCTIDDSNTQYDDATAQQDSTCISVQIVKVLSADPTTHEISSVLPAYDLPRQHFVTVKQTASGQDRMQLEAQILPNTDAARRCVTWVGAQADAANPLVGLVPRTAALKQPVEIQLAGRTCKRLVAWVIWCSLSSPDESRMLATPGYKKSPAGVEQWKAMARIRWIAEIHPIEIITDPDHPNLEGPPDPNNLPQGTNSSGDLLAGGVNAKWDMSRQIRTRSYSGDPLVPDANPKPIDNNPSYPTSEVVGNDDTRTDNWDNNPYDLGTPLGQLTSGDTPSRAIDAFVGSLGDKHQWKLQFREFVRVELEGHWYRCSDWGLWRFHIAAIYAERDGIAAWRLDDPPGVILELNNDDWGDT